MQNIPYKPPFFNPVISLLHTCFHPANMLCLLQKSDCPLTTPLVLFHSFYRIIYVLLLASVVSWLALDTAQRGTRQIVSFFGLFFLIFLMFLFSKHPFRVRHAFMHTHAHAHACTLINEFFRLCLQWSCRTLLWGIGLQFIFALLSFRTTFGLRALQWLGQQAEVHKYMY